MAEPSPSPFFTREGPLAFTLSLVAGFVDTAGFIALFGLFTAHVTGNLLLVGASVVQAEAHGVFARLAVIPLFMFAVMAGALLAQQARARNRHPLPGLLLAETFALGLVTVIGVALQDRLTSAAQEWTVVAIGGCAVVAMGLHNALMREAAPKLLPTTVMTGNFTAFSIDLLALLRTRGPERAAARARFGRTGPVLGGFVVGAALGAAGISTLRWWSLALPTVVTAILALANWRLAPPPAAK